MNDDSQAAIIANDLNSLVHRIEALRAHPRYTDALQAVQKAEASINAGRTALHRAHMEADELARSALASSQVEPKVSPTWS